ncbi:MAG: hypothetical protein ACRCX2_28400 [Paraclostridium sp.]
MDVKGLVGSAKKFFTNYSVNSMQGYKKVSLLEVDEDRNATGFKVTLDATTNVDLNISKQLMQHSSESKQVYMDGTKRNPMKMTISGHISTEHLLDIQRMADDDVWMYLYMSKEMGGAYLSVSKPPKNASVEFDLALKKNVNHQEGTTSWDLPSAKANYEPYVQVWADCTLYTIESLSIKDEGFKNTVAVTINLSEVVLFEYDVRYKFGIKQNKDGGQKVQQTAITEVPKDAGKTILPTLY